MNKEFLTALNTFAQDGKNLIIVTMIKARGSAPQEIGAKIIVNSDGLLYGTVGGGKVEIKAIGHAREMLKDEKRTLDMQDWNLQTDVGMTCGGVVTFSFEKFIGSPAWEIAIFGAGHVAQELVRTLINLDCLVSCIDQRAEWINKLPDHPRLKKVVSEKMSDYVALLSSKTFIVSMTMGHAFDLPILTEVFRRDCFPYVGAIGSKSKALVLRNDLLKNGVAVQMVEKLICPVGEQLGNNTPAEIAISIAAQLLKYRDLNEAQLN